MVLVFIGVVALLDDVTEGSIESYEAVIARFKACCQGDEIMFSPRLQFFIWSERVYECVCMRERERERESEMSGGGINSSRDEDRERHEMNDHINVDAFCVVVETNRERERETAMQCSSMHIYS